MTNILRSRPLSLVATISMFLIICNVAIAAPKNQTPSKIPFFISEYEQASYTSAIDVVVIIDLSLLPTACDGKNRFLNYASGWADNGFTSLNDYDFAQIQFGNGQTLQLKPPVSITRLGFLIFSQEFNVVIPTETTELIFRVQGINQDHTVFMGGGISLSGFCTDD